MSKELEAAIVLIPRLRRHARLLTGSREVGDEYVRLCLELIAAEPERLLGGPLARCLFRAFHVMFNGVEAGLEEAGRGGNETSGLASGIAVLPSLQRRALLLQVVESFSPEDVAHILDLQPSLVSALVAEAREELMRSTARSVLIIEDEPIIAMDLARIVRTMGHTVAAIASREASALEQAEMHRPELVLADVQLLDEGNGIMAAQNILDRFDVPVVFVTAFPERLLTGGRLEPAFVVGKPFDEEALKVTLDQALRTYANVERARSHKRELLAKLSSITGQSIGLRA